MKTPPPIGPVAEHESDDQRYELVAIRPHTCWNGRPTDLLVWRTHCAKCGTEFETITRRRSLVWGVLRYPGRHCPAHRRTRRL